MFSVFLYLELQQQKETKDQGLREDARDYVVNLINKVEIFGTHSPYQ